MFNDTEQDIQDEFVEPDEGSLAEVEGLLEEDFLTRRALVVLVGDRVLLDDRTGSLMAELLDEEGFGVDAIVTAAPDVDSVRKTLETAVVGGADLVVTVGGVSVGPRDQVPEATREVMDMRVIGLEEAVRSSGLAVGSFDAGLSRGLAGVSGQTVIVNLADSRSAIRDGMATVLPMVKHLCDDLGRWSLQ